MAEDDKQLNPFGKARSTVVGEPLSKEELDKYTRFFHATCYMALG